MATQILRTVPEAQRFSEAASLERRRLALVPTMGYLHEGHLSLMREARGRADVVVTSIFVNPTQFGPKEDLSHYPRDFEGDLSKCEGVGVDAVFAPDASALYPPGYQTYVEVAELSKGLCGERRPGHFRGVATVVTKLFNLFRPQVALFGEKDYQQLLVLKALARDLDMGVEVVGLPTVREPDGLAMSSRNAYLSSGERGRALSLSRGLREAQSLARDGVSDTRTLVMAVRRELQEAGVREDYVEIVDAATLTPLSSLAPGQGARILVAGFLGTTRLIDNMAIGG